MDSPFNVLYISLTMQFCQDQIVCILAVYNEFFLHKTMFRFKHIILRHNLYLSIFVCHFLNIIIIFSLLLANLYILLPRVRGITRNVSAWRWEGDGFDARP